MSSKKKKRRRGDDDDNDTDWRSVKKKKTDNSEGNCIIHMKESNMASFKWRNQIWHHSNFWTQKTNKLS